MTGISNPAPSGALTGVAGDSRSLDSLRRLAEQDPAKAVKQVATQFEAQFLQMVLKSMRDATPKSGLLDSNEQQTYTSMLDQELAQKIAGGTGLADVIARQLSRNLPRQAGTAAPGASPAASPAGTSAATPVGAAAAVPDKSAQAMVQSIRAAQSLRGK